MIQKYFLALCLFVGSLCFSQEQTINKKLTPISIYTTAFKTSSIDKPTYNSIKKNLNLNTSYKFKSVSFEDIDNGRFLFSKDNLKGKPTKFIYDDYKSYRDENLLKGFLQKHDLTRWTVCNFRQPNLN